MVITRDNTTGFERQKNGRIVPSVCGAGWAALGDTLGIVYETIIILYQTDTPAEKSLALVLSAWYQTLKDCKLTGEDAWCTYRNSSPKNNHSVIIYTPTLSSVEHDDILKNIFKLKVHKNTEMLFKIFFWGRTNVIQVWNDMRENKWWLNSFSDEKSECLCRCLGWMDVPFLLRRQRDLRELRQALGVLLLDLDPVDINECIKVVLHWTAYMTHIQQAWAQMSNPDIHTKVISFPDSEWNVSPQGWGRVTLALHTLLLNPNICTNIIEKTKAFKTISETQSFNHSFFSFLKRH